MSLKNVLNAVAQGYKSVFVNPIPIDADCLDCLDGPSPIDAMLARAEYRQHHQQPQAKARPTGPWTRGKRPF